nr:hypothetical protein CFP56_09094 [Quercus suber]
MLLALPTAKITAEVTEMLEQRKDLTLEYILNTPNIHRYIVNNGSSSSLPPVVMSFAASCSATSSFGYARTSYGFELLTWSHPVVVARRIEPCRATHCDAQDCRCYRFKKVQYLNGPGSSVATRCSMILAGRVEIVCRERNTTADRDYYCTVGYCYNGTWFHRAHSFTAMRSIGDWWSKRTSTVHR